MAEEAARQFSKPFDACLPPLRGPRSAEVFPHLRSTTGKSEAASELLQLQFTIFLSHRGPLEWKIRFVPQLASVLPLLGPRLFRWLLPRALQQVMVACFFLGLM